MWLSIAVLSYDGGLIFVHIDTLEYTLSSLLSLLRLSCPFSSPHDSVDSGTFFCIMLCCHSDGVSCMPFCWCLQAYLPSVSLDFLARLQMWYCVCRICSQLAILPAGCFNLLHTVLSLIYPQWWSEFLHCIEWCHVCKVFTCVISWNVSIHTFYKTWIPRQWDIPKSTMS